MERFKRWWRNRGRRWWTDYHWPILLGIGFAALVLGFIGFTKHAFVTGEERTILDNLYLTLGLLSLNSGAVPGPIPWELQVARFLVPAITAYTALLALAMVFTQQSEQVRLWSMHEHVIIGGFGRKGVRLAKQFRDRGYKVVIIEGDESNDWVEAMRSSDIVVLNGDASDPEMLRKARLNHARFLIAVTGNDGKNAEVAVQAAKLSYKRGNGTLTCSIHIVDPQLWYLLREKELKNSLDSHFRLELFNIYDRGASLLLKTHSPWGNDHNTKICDKHLVLVGAGKLGQSLVIQATSQWRERRISEDQRLKITIIDLHATQKVETLSMRFPNLEDVCDLNPLDMDVRSADFQCADFLYDETGTYAVDIVYICMDNDALSLHTGLALHQKIKDHNIPVIVRMVEDAGLALLLKDSNNKETYKNLHAFPLLDQTCTPDLILLGTHEALARYLYESYLEGLKKGGSKNNQTLDSWDELPDDAKEKNRKQADRIGVILENYGYHIATLTDWKASGMVFRKEDGLDEIEALAHLEHDLWSQEMKAEGWHYGPTKSREHKTHPDLVPWDALPAEEKEKNKKFIRDLPKILARAGFQIERKNYN